LNSLFTDGALLDLSSRQQSGFSGLEGITRGDGGCDNASCLVGGCNPPLDVAVADYESYIAK
jgi:hypothetical protein